MNKLIIPIWIVAIALLIIAVKGIHFTETNITQAPPVSAQSAPPPCKRDPNLTDKGNRLLRGCP